MNLLLTIMLGVLLARPSGEGTWRWSNPRPHGNNILDIELANGVYWQMGDRGQVYTSVDALTWIPRKSGTSKSLRSMTAFKGKVYMVGAEGVIVSGSNPEVLTVQAINTSAWLEGVAASAELIVAAADDGAIYTSPDGAQWTRRGSFTTALSSVACLGSTFVAVGAGGFVAQSSNGIDWVGVSPFTAQSLNGVNATAGRFWVTGNSGVLATNRVGGGWQLVNLGVTNDLFTADSNSGQVMVGGDRLLLVATHQFDRMARQTNGVPDWLYYSSLWDGQRFLVGGKSGMLLQGKPLNGGSIYEWSSRVQESRSWLWKVAETPHLYLAAGASGTIMTSENGFNWYRETTPESVHRDIFMGLAGNADVGVAVGTEGAIIYTRNIMTNWVSSSPEGGTVTNTASLYGLLWNAVSPRPTARSLQGLAERNGTFVAAGAGGTILTSSDGASWSPRLSGTTNTLSSVAASPSTWVVTGDVGTVLTSADRLVWAARNAGVTNWIYAVRWMGSQFVAVGEGGLLLRSADGISWQRQSVGTSLWLNDIAIHAGKYYVFSDDGYIGTSSDLVNWNVQPTITIRSLYSAMAADGRLIAVGTDGTILQMRPYNRAVQIIDYVRQGVNDHFLFGAEAGQYFQVQRSSALPGNWNRLMELQIEDEDGTLEESFSTSGERNFFRTFAQP